MNKELSISEKEERMYKFVEGERIEDFKYKVNALPMLANLHDECEREQMVSYYQMAPLVQQTVPLQEADYVIFAHPFARVEDFTDIVLKQLESVNEYRKKDSELIIVGKAANIKPYIEGKYNNVTYVDRHFTKYLGKRFNLDMKEEYILYDDREDQLNMWPVDGCLNKCGFCRRTYMDIPFESQTLEFLEEKLDWFKENHPEQMKHLYIRAENLTEYGMDIYGKQELHKVIDLAASYDEVENIYMPIGMCIGEITPEILDSLCRCKKLKQIALNLEAGSDRLLKLIGKKHTREQSKLIYSTLREAHPDLAIATTVMIGLPTEELEDIYQLGQLINEVEPTSVLCNFYGYSSKHPIAKYPQINEQVKYLHQNFLMKILKEKKDRDFFLKFSYEKAFGKNKRIDEREKKEIEQEQLMRSPRVLNQKCKWFCNDGIVLNKEEFDAELYKNKLKEKNLKGIAKIKKLK